MKLRQKLVIEQLDKKLLLFGDLADQPQKGWVHAIRTGVKMSLRQLAMRLGIAIASAKEIEDREKNGTITIKSLREAARALNMKLVYGLVPMSGTLETMIDQKAEEVARKIVLRTSNTMKLEDQTVSKERLEQAIKDLAIEIKNEMPRYLWD